MQTTRFDEEMKAFCQNFSSFMGKRVVLYGIGRYTSTIIEKNTSFEIIGVCDRDPNLIGKTVFGVPVLSQREVENLADFLVINTGSNYWHTIYQRISDWNIPIFFRDGTKAEKAKKSNRENTYWSCCYDDLLHQIQSHEVVSFDLFDTLLMRRVMAPIDVFRIVEERIRTQSDVIADQYIEWRPRIACKSAEPNFDEIYEFLQEKNDWTGAVTQQIKQIEFDTELSLIVPRNDIVEAFYIAMKHSDVYIVSDMYFTVEQLTEIIHKIGLSLDKKHIIVSCEIGLSKQSGVLWKWFQENVVRGRSSLHIGDNSVADGFRANENGIDTFYVMNSIDMLMNSSIDSVSGRVISVSSSLILGTVLANLFNSPFALNHTQGMVAFDDERSAGYALLGAVGASFCLWLKERAENDDVDKLVFLARDGFLLKQIYECASKTIGDNWPSFEYIETSRRMMVSTSIVDEKGIWDEAQVMHRGNAKDFLGDRFGVVIDSEELEKIDISELAKDQVAFQEFLLKYKDAIIARMSWERENYYQYLDSINLGKQYAFVDICFYGAIQYKMQRFLGIRFPGYYMCACLDPTNQYLTENVMHACFQDKDDLSANNCAIRKYDDFIEAFFTSPNGTALYVDEGGEIVHDINRSNQVHFDVREKMMTGVCAFVRDFLTLYKELDLGVSNQDTLFADFLLGIFLDDGFIPLQTMKDGFFYDNSISYKTENQIWG